MSNNTSDQKQGAPDSVAEQKANRGTNREPDRSAQHPRTGAVGGDESPAADTPIGLPAKDGSPLGDSDQHSTAATSPGHPRR